MPTPRPRPDTSPAMKLSVGVGEPSADREALAVRRRLATSLFPASTSTDTHTPARAPFAWVLAGDTTFEDLLYGPDWAW